MNLNFTEVDDLGNKEPFDVNSYQTNNYWETSNTPVQKKKKISYDDILNSLNLVVNKSGVLQYMSVNPAISSTNTISSTTTIFSTTAIYSTKSATNKRKTIRSTS